MSFDVDLDLSMSKGIAVEFKKRFGGVEELKKQNKAIGEVATLELDHRFVFYMITKEKYFHKPTYASFESSLTNLRDKAINLGVKHIAMPKIGCGLDKLDWSRVSDMIKRLFKSSGIQITVYTL
jgi:O-acetyl-ADP-ribose deacetylase (regulator of RNase III)